MRHPASGPFAASLLLAGALLLGALPSPAQTLEGRVRMGEKGVSGVPVELHRVTRDSAGVVQRGTTGPDGAFTFTLPPPEEGGFSVLFGTAEFRGVRYFGAPIHSSEPLAGYTVEVHDTLSASAAPGAVRVVRRDLILLPEEDGSAEANEIVRIRNTAERTLVPGARGFSWAFHLPEGAAAFEVGEGQLSSESVKRMGDRVLLTASLPPGEHEVFVRYRLGREARRTALPLAPGTDSLNLFVRQPSAELTVAALPAPSAVRVDRETFLRFSGAGLEGTPEVVLEWDRAAPPPVDPRVAAVVVTGLLLAAGAGVAARRREKGA